MNGQTRILITGGAGLIGRRTAEILSNRGLDVTILDINLEGRKAILQKLGDKVHYLEGDIKSKEFILNSVKDKDIVVHLAAGSSFFMYEERPIYETTNVIQGFLNVLEAVKHHHTQKLIYASTSAVYEGNELPYKEDMTLCPPDHKALAKKVNEEMAQLYSKRYGIRTIGIRPFSVYGIDEADKGGLANVISLFTWAMLSGNAPIIWGDGNQTRDFIFVDDLAEFIYRCIVSNIDVPVVNAGTGVETSFNDVVAIISDYLGVELDPVYVEVPIDIYARRLKADVSLQEIIGLKTKTTIRDGIAQVVDAARSMDKSLILSLGRAQELITDRTATQFQQTPHQPQL